MNKSNLQVFLETSEKIASEKIVPERKQRLDEIFGGVEVEIDRDAGRVEMKAKAIGWPGALVSVGWATAYAAVAIAAINAYPVALAAFTALVPVAWAFYRYKKIAQFVKNNFPRVGDFLEKNRMNPDEQMELYVSKLREELSKSKEVKMTEEQIDAFIEFVVTRISEDEKCKEISEKMTAALQSEKNNELLLYRLTNQYDKAIDKVYEKLAREAREIYTISPDEQEPEEELAMVAESKQYNRWKVIAGVER